MLVVAAYDINTEESAGRRRLRRVAHACEDYGVRVQKSVFEIAVDDARWVTVRSRLLGEIDPSQDSLRIYFIDEAARKRTEHHGIGVPPDLSGPLIV